MQLEVEVDVNGKRGKMIVPLKDDSVGLQARIKLNLSSGEDSLNLSIRQIDIHWNERKEIELRVT